ncbi:MAG: hypothetical protein KatS3mg068_0250 [Candidatus Sericytochromatia bacterium]|nr:MAG: hypothetical protein KatS3mg068_0250 [Candidatus Sericytochromatia bacterium]
MIKKIVPLIFMFLISCSDLNISYNNEQITSFQLRNDLYPFDINKDFFSFI